MQSNNDIIVTSCLSDCKDCTGIYVNNIFGSKIVCTCRCHKKNGQALDLVGGLGANAIHNTQSNSKESVQRK
jgi:hypothetical protein